MRHPLPPRPQQLESTPPLSAHLPATLYFSEIYRGGATTVNSTRSPSFSPSPFSSVTSQDLQAPPSARVKLKNGSQSKTQRAETSCSTPPPAAASSSSSLFNLDEDSIPGGDVGSKIGGRGGGSDWRLTPITPDSLPLQRVPLIPPFDLFSPGRERIRPREVALLKYLPKTMDPRCRPVKRSPIATPPSPPRPAHPTDRLPSTSTPTSLPPVVSNDSNSSDVRMEDVDIALKDLKRCRSSSSPSTRPSKRAAAGIAAPSTLETNSMDAPPSLPSRSRLPPTELAPPPLPVPSTLVNDSDSTASSSSASFPSVSSTASDLNTLCTSRPAIQSATVKSIFEEVLGQPITMPSNIQLLAVYKDVAGYVPKEKIVELREYIESLVYQVALAAHVSEAILGVEGLRVGEKETTVQYKGGVNETEEGNL